jgi:hypothetical protein
MTEREQARNVARRTRSARTRIGSAPVALAFVVLLSACELGSTDVAGEDAGQAQPNRP